MAVCKKSRLLPIAQPLDLKPLFLCTNDVQACFYGYARVTITDVRAGDTNLSYPRYIGGERNGPPEDCGGLPGFYETLDAATDAEHPDHAEAKLWLDDYDPKEFDELPIKYASAGSQTNEMPPRPASQKRNQNRPVDQIQIRQSKASPATSHQLRRPPP
jgi:hypothetical protein